MAGSAHPVDPAWPGITVVVPTWNGLGLLHEYLPSVVAAVAAYPGPCECLVIDDGGTDATGAELPALFPQARLIRRERNGGFAAAVTTGFAAAAHPLVLLLNNDIRVPPDFLTPLARHFQADAAGGKDDLFAVASVQINPATDDAINPSVDGCRELRFVGGELCFPLPSVPPRPNDPPRPTALANGGCTLFSRARVEALGGFCPLFNPFYYEDAELSVQALRRGWRIVCEPGSTVWHRPNTTTGQHQQKVSVTSSRNAFIFQWMFLDGFWMWAVHLACIFPRAVSRTLQGRFEYVQGLWRALGAWRAVRRARRARGADAGRSLRQVIASRTPN